MIDSHVEWKHWGRWKHTCKHQTSNEGLTARAYVRLRSIPSVGPSRSLVGYSAVPVGRFSMLSDGRSVDDQYFPAVGASPAGGPLPRPAPCVEEE